MCSCRVFRLVTMRRGITAEFPEEPGSGGPRQVGRIAYGVALQSGASPSANPVSGRTRNQDRWQRTRPGSSGFCTTTRVQRHPAGDPPTTGASTRTSRACAGGASPAPTRGRRGAAGVRSRTGASTRPSSRRVGAARPRGPRRGRRVRRRTHRGVRGERGSTRPAPRWSPRAAGRSASTAAPARCRRSRPFTSTARRRRPPRTVEERLAGDPTRIIAWAFMLGLLLILIAILTA